MQNLYQVFLLQSVDPYHYDNNSGIPISLNGDRKTWIFIFDVSSIDNLTELCYAWK